MYNLNSYTTVSVSLRSIIHSYKSTIAIVRAGELMFPSPYGVSFILMKISAREWLIFGGYVSFRLLTEYHSFL